jgi:hypothetical protein
VTQRHNAAFLLLQQANAVPCASAAKPGRGHTKNASKGTLTDSPTRLSSRGVACCQYGLPVAIPRPAEHSPSTLAYNTHDSATGAR